MKNLKAYGPTEYCHDGSLLWIVPLEEGHADDLFAVQPVEQTLVVPKDKRRDLLREYILKGPAFSGMWHGRIVASAGVAILAPGIGQGWGFFTPAVRQLGPLPYAVVADWLCGMIRHHALRRLQVSVDIRENAAVRYVEGLGFLREGTMRNFGPDGGDHYLYAMALEV